MGRVREGVRKDEGKKKKKEGWVDILGEENELKAVVVRLGSANDD